MSRLQESITYIQNINGLAGMAMKVQSQASRLAKPELIERMLALPIGGAEKSKALLGLTAKDENYRKAGRALLLIELLYEYHGDGPVENFLAQRRAGILQFLTEERLRTAIGNKLNGLPHFVINGLVHRTYSDRNSAMPAVSVNALSVAGHQGGAPAMLTGQGKWRYVFMSDTPGLLDFTTKPSAEGIFSTDAAGGCIVVAFLYGGKKGQPLKAASLVHIPGGNPFTANWNGMRFGNHEPSTIAVFLSSLNNLSGSEQDAYLTYLTINLNYPEQLILFHLTSDTTAHGVDRWGNFGRAFAPSGQTSRVFRRADTYVHLP